MQAIINNGLSVPKYCPDILSFDQAHAYEEKLPLVYIWTESLNNNERRYVVSINGHALDGILKKHCLFHDVKYQAIKKELLSLLTKVSSDLVSSYCRRYEAVPSQIFEVKRI